MNPSTSFEDVYKVQKARIAYLEKGYKSLFEAYDYLKSHMQTDGQIGIALDELLEVIKSLKEEIHT